MTPKNLENFIKSSPNMSGCLEGISADFLVVFGKKYFLTSEPWLASQVSRVGRVKMSKSEKIRNFYTTKSIETECFWSFLRVSGLSGPRKLRWCCVRIVPGVI